MPYTVRSMAFRDPLGRSLSLRAGFYGFIPVAMIRTRNVPSTHPNPSENGFAPIASPGATTRIHLRDSPGYDYDSAMGSSPLPVPEDGGTAARLRADLAEARAALKKSAGDQHRLAHAAADAVKAERRRLAQLLHDSVSQSLMGIYFQAQVIAKKLDAGGLDKTREVAGLAEMIRGAVLELSQIAHGLQPQEKAASDPVSPPNGSGRRLPVGAQRCPARAAAARLLRVTVRRPDLPRGCLARELSQLEPAVSE